MSVCLSVLPASLDVSPECEKKKRDSCQGFTLLELIFGILIVLTLAAIAVPLFADYLHKAKVDRAVLDIRTLEKEIILFEMERGYYPGGRQPEIILFEMERGYYPGGRQPIITFMLESMHEIGKDHFKDPWGTPYQYRNLAQGPHTGGGKPKFCRRDRSYNPLNYDFDLYSVGPDRQVPTHNQITSNKGADDIVRAANGRYVGVGAKF
ncbi:MAG: type II secretion system protein GspG [Deltaproteobacteria bacterium]|nr:type II secretion system protein GspG [Deltaproteobacteria bacterium]